MVSPEQMREEATVSGPGDVAAFSDGFFSFNLMRTKKKKAHNFTCSNTP